MAFMWLGMSLPSESIAGPCLNIKMIYFQVWDFHYKDKTAVRPSDVLNENYILQFSMGYDYIYVTWTQAQYVYMSFKRF